MRRSALLTRSMHRLRGSSSCAYLVRGRVSGRGRGRGTARARVGAEVRVGLEQLGLSRPRQPAGPHGRGAPWSGLGIGSGLGLVFVFGFGCGFGSGFGFGFGFGFEFASALESG